MTSHKQTQQTVLCSKRTMSVANMAKAVVKSSQEMGSLALREVTSRRRMSRVTQKQKHHVNMHQVQ